MLANSLILLVSLVFLLLSADWFVDGAVALAKRLKVSPMAIGLSVVAIGTSLPELASSAVAARNGYPGIALGNVVGSNICNVAFILALSALIAPIFCNTLVLKREGSLLLIATAVFWFLASYLNEVSRIGGFSFLLGFIIFLIIVFRRTEMPIAAPTGKRFVEVSEEALNMGIQLEDKESKLRKSLSLVIIQTIIALVIVILSSDYLVNATVELARQIKISEDIIALTMIALGTSLPELSVSIVSARKKEGDILVGNILGSNITNILLVLGASAAIRPIAIPPGSMTILFDFPLMFLTSGLMILFLYQKNGLNKIKGCALLLLYGLMLVRCVYWI